jgi:hypothetical protein
MSPLLQWRNNKYCTFWECVCSLSNPECNAYESYCCLWPVRFYCVLIFSTNLSETFFILRRIEWPVNKCIFIFMQRNCYSCEILMKLWFPRKILEKFPNIKFHENPFSDSRAVSRGHTDRQIDGQTWWN